MKKQIIKAMRIICVAILITLVPFLAFSQECNIKSADNPNVSYSINPNVTYKWNPDVTYSINPNVTYSINPNVTYKYNPNVTYSINPNVTTSLNPTKDGWNGYYVFTPNCEFVGASVVANDEVMILFAGEKWIGQFITNHKGGYNFFNRENEWKGFLVPTDTGGFAFFNRDKDWLLSLLVGSKPPLIISTGLDFFDSHGKATAFIERGEGSTIYLWSGKPVAYLEEDSVFGFNGKHIGWYKEGAIYDADGEVVVAVADRFADPPGEKDPKGLKGLKPLKGLKELKPLKPLFNKSWSTLSPILYFMQGVE